MSDADNCLVCGEIIPEGRQICPQCEFAQTIREETIAEFAERLKAFYRRLPGHTVGGSIEYHINQVLKEMNEKWRG